MKFLIESPHTKQECLRELDDLSAKGKGSLGQFYWGCGKGDHTGYAIVDARDVNAALNLVPDFVRDKAKVVEVTQFSDDQIRSMHKAA